VFPLLFTEHGLGLAAVGLIKGLYPLLWGLGQIPTGHLADRIGRIPLIVTRMLVQAVAFVVALVLLEWPLLAGIASAVLLGIGPPWFHTTPQHHHRGPHRQTPEVGRRGADRLELTESDPDGGDGEHPLLFVAEVDVLERYLVATSRRPQLDRIARPLHNQPRRSGMPVRHVLGTRITRRP
jgi:hypothetical protein